MSKIKHFPSLYSDRKVSVLTIEAQNAARELGEAIIIGKVNNELLDTFRKSLIGIKAATIPQASAEIRDIAKLYHYYSSQPIKTIAGKIFNPLRSRRPTVNTQLNTYPELGWILLFHADGMLREAALHSIKTFPKSEFEFSLIAYRLNDWVPEIRTAAYHYAKKSFPNVSSEIIAESGFFLLSQIKQLSRWESECKELLHQALYRQDVLEDFAERFSTLKSGKIGHSLRQLLKRDDFDIHLQKLAIQAKMPNVRAVAMETLLLKRARWFIGYSRKWIDKRYGFSRRIPSSKTRQLDIDIDTENLLKLAAEDKFANVRKIVTRYLIDKLETTTPFMDQVARNLLADKNISVSSRAKFYWDKRKTALEL